MTALTDPKVRRERVEELRNPNTHVSENLRNELADALEHIDRLANRVDGYQASRDHAIAVLAKALKVTPDTVRAVEYYATEAAARISALEKALRGLMTRQDFWNGISVAGYALPGEYDTCLELLEHP